MHEKYGGPNSNGFQLKWRFGTHGNWKKSKSWGPFWSYQISSTANSAHFARFLVNGLNWQCCLAGSSKTAPSILILLITLTISKLLRKKMRAKYWNHFWYQMSNRHLWQSKKSKSWGPFWSYQLNSTANSAYSQQKWAKWAELAVLFSW